MTPRLLLNSTKPKDYARNAREEEVCGVCRCSILYPLPCIYRREPPAAAPQTDLKEQQGGATWQSWSGGAHGPGRPTYRSAGLPWLPTAPNCWGLGLSGPPCLIHTGVGLSWLVLLRFLGYTWSIWAWIGTLIFFVIFCWAKVCLQPAY